MEEVDGVIADAIDAIRRLACLHRPRLELGNIHPALREMAGPLRRQEGTAVADEPPSATAAMVANYADAILTAALSHDGDELMAEPRQERGQARETEHVRRRRPPALRPHEGQAPLASQDRRLPPPACSRGKPRRLLRRRQGGQQPAAAHLHLLRSVDGRARAPQSPLWWLTKLYRELSARQATMRGWTPTTGATIRCRSSRRRTTRRCAASSGSCSTTAARTSWARRRRGRGAPEGRGVPALRQHRPALRQEVVGDLAGEPDGRRVAPRSIEALVKGVSYLSSGTRREVPDDRRRRSDADDRRLRPRLELPAARAALKVWRDDWTGDAARERLPARRHLQVRAPRRTPATRIGSRPERADPWVERRTSSSEPLGIVPIVPLRNRPRLLLEGESELSDVFRIQNQINGFLFLLALAGYFGAHKQRWAVGLTIMEDEQTGKPVEPFDVDVESSGSSPSENPRGEVRRVLADRPDGYIKSIEQKVLHIAVTTRTPRTTSSRRASRRPVTRSSPPSPAREEGRAKHGRSARASKRRCGSRACSTARTTRRSTPRSSGPTRRRRRSQTLSPTR
jgi:hypothetical protein